MDDNSYIPPKSFEVETKKPPLLPTNPKKIFRILLSITCLGLAALVINLWPYKNTKNLLSMTQNQNGGKVEKTDLDKLPNFVTSNEFKTQPTTLFSFGGINRSEKTATSSAQYLDPQSGIWESLPNMQVSRYWASTASYNNKVYVFGGNINEKQITQSVEEYDIALGKWTTKLNMPTVRTNSTAISLGTKIYLIGGNTLDGKIVTTVDIYSPDTNRWTRGKDTPSIAKPITPFECAPINDKIYCPLLGNQSYTLRFDQVTNIWDQIPSENRSLIENANSWAQMGDTLTSTDNEPEGTYFINYQAKTDSFKVNKIAVSLDSKIKQIQSLFGNNLLIVAEDEKGNLDYLVANLSNLEAPKYYILPQFPNIISGQSILSALQNKPKK